MTPDVWAPPDLPGRALLGAALLACITVVAGVVVVLWWRRRLAARHTRGGSLIRIQAPPEVDPDSAAAFFAYLAATGTPWWRRWILGQAHVVFEYSWAGERFEIRVWVPGTLSARAIGEAVKGAWPASDVTIEAAGDPLPEHATAVATGALRPQHGDVTGWRADQRADPVRLLLAAASGLREGEAVVVQVAVRPASRWRVARLRRASAASNGSVWPGVLAPKASESSVPVTPWQRRQRARLLERLDAAMLETDVRYAVATTRGDKKQARARVRSLADGIATAIGMHSGADPLRRARVLGLETAIRSRRMAGGVLATSAEVAALAHLPLDAIVPQLSRAGARSVAPVSEVPRGGRNTKRLGTANGRPVALPVADARHHLHIVGSTGTGKSTLLLNLILGDIKAGRGVVVVDPKGDLVTDVLARLDQDALGERLVVIDPDRPGPHPGLNPLSGDDPDVVVDHLVGICRRIWERHWGPRADDVLRSALLTLLRKPGTTLKHLPSLLSKREFRAPITVGIDDPAGLGGFWEWYDTLAPGLQSQVIGPVLSRIRALMTRKFVRATLGAPTTSVDVGRLMDTGGILLARLPKGQLGEDTARLMGSVIVAKTWQAATKRARLPEDKRRDASLYLDEAQNFLTLPGSLDDILAEARGYRLSLVLAHQHMAQLPREMQFAISANARTKAFFTTSPEDARLLSRHTLPHLTEHDLAHLEAYTAACRLMVNGREQPAFTLQTEPAPPPGTPTAAPTVTRRRSGRQSGARSDRTEEPTPPRPVTSQVSAGEDR